MNWEKSQNFGPPDPFLDLAVAKSLQSTRMVSDDDADDDDDDDIEDYDDDHNHHLHACPFLHIITVFMTMEHIISPTEVL